MFRSCRRASNVMRRDSGAPKSQSFGSILICVTATHAPVAFVLALAHICSVSGQRGAAAFQPLFTGAAAAAMERIGMRGWHSKLSLLVQCRAAKVIYAVSAGNGASQQPRSRDVLAGTKTIAAVSPPQGLRQLVLAP